MGSPGEVELRLARLERQQAEHSKAQDDVKKELARQDARFDATLDVFGDYNEAIMYLLKYLIHFTLESVEHALMISSATTKFAGFLKLPPTSSSINLYVDLAFTAVTAVFPAMRLLKILDGITKEANVALAIARATETMPQRLATGIVQGVPKVQEVSDVLKRANDTRMKALAALKDDGATKAVAELANLNSSNGPIRHFVETATHAVTVFDNVANVISVDFAIRIKHPDIQRKETMTDMTRRILGAAHNFPDPNELNQLETTYIWEMIAGYCRDNVVFVKQTGWGAQDGVSVRGLNSGQLDALMDLFGPIVARGRYFTKPLVVPNGSMYLVHIGAKTVIEDTGRMPPR
jgi:hypothetical protein